MKKILGIVLCLIIVFMFADAPINDAMYSCDWPMPRKDVANTGFTHDSCRPQCDDLKLQWYYPEHMAFGEVHSPPSVITLSKGFDDNSNIWGDIDENGVDDFYQRAYFGTEMGYVFCVNAIQWLPGHIGIPHWRWIETVQSIEGTPAFYDDLIFFGTSLGNFYCLYAETGIKKWDDSGLGSIDGSAIVINERVYFGSSDKYLYCYDCYSGKQLWNFEVRAEINNTPSYGLGRVYFTTSDNKIWWVREGSTKPTNQGSKYEWDNHSILNVQCENRIETSYAQEMVHINAQRNYFFDRNLSKDYASIKETTVTGQAIDPGYSCQCKYAPRVYFVANTSDEDGKKLVCLVNKDRIRAWFPEPTNPHFTECKSLPSVTNKRVYLTGGSHIFTFNATTGDLINDLDWGFAELTPISIAYERIYTACRNGIVYCFGCGSCGGEGECPYEEIIISHDNCKCICVGESTVFDVIAIDHNGNTVSNIDVEWSVSDPYIGWITQDGVFTGLRPGKVKIVAKYITDYCYLVDTCIITVCDWGCD